MVGDNPGFPDQNGGAASVASTLLRLLKDNDSEAWRRIVKLFGPLVYTWCRGSGLQAADASDVGQEVFRAVAANITRFRREGPGDSFRGWLWTITRNKIKDHMRRRVRQPQAFGGTTAQQRFAAVPAVDLDSDVDPGGSDSRDGVLRRALELIRSQFNARTWRAFWEVTVAQRDPAEVGAALHMTVNAVYLAKSRVLRRLRDEFGDVLT